MNLLNSLLALEFNFDRFLKSFQYMGKGMLGIFIVIGIIVVGISLLNKLSSREKKNNNDNNQE